MQYFHVIILTRDGGLCDYYNMLCLVTRKSVDRLRHKKNFLRNIEAGRTGGCTD